MFRQRIHVNFITSNNEGQVELVFASCTAKYYVSVIEPVIIFFGTGT